MKESGPLRVLFACRDRETLAGVESSLRDAGIRVEVAESPEEARRAMGALSTCAVALIDTGLASAVGENGIKTLQDAAGGRFPIVLVAGAVERRWEGWLASEMIDDLVPSTAAPDYWRLRLEMTVRSFRRNRELRALRETSASWAQNLPQVDPLTGIYSRTALLSLLFRETDRVQRMRTCLTMVLFDLAGEEAVWAVDARQAMVELVPRLNRLLRSYDLLGEVKRNTFLIALPGCSEANAVRLVERARTEVFSTSLGGMRGAEPLGVCFGVAESHGRSPLVVLREAEQALRQARITGAGTIRSSGGRHGPRNESTGIAGAHEENASGRREPQDILERA